MTLALALFGTTSQRNTMLIGDTTINQSSSSELSAFSFEFPTCPTLNQPPDCSGAVIADLIANADCGAEISGADVAGVFDPDGDELTVAVAPAALSAGANVVSVSVDDGNGGTCATDVVVNVVGGAGTISGIVTNGTDPLAGVMVKLLEAAVPTNVLQEDTTGALGEYEFAGPAGVSIQIMVVEPLGYAAQQNDVVGAVACGGSLAIDFVLDPFVLVNNARSKGYWKHQFDVHVKNRGHAQESESDLAAYIEEVRARYTLPHYQAVFADMADGVTDFEEWQDVLSVKGNAGMEAKALAQLAALALNVMSLKIGQYELVSEDDGTAGDVLTYVSDLLTDVDPSNDELAKDLAESVNQQQIIGAGVVPSSAIQFARPVVAERGLAFSPNPGGPHGYTIMFAMPAPGPVELAIFDVSGRRVATVLSGNVEAGRHEVRWASDPLQRQQLGAGVYFGRLRTPGGTATAKFVHRR